MEKKFFFIDNFHLRFTITVYIIYKYIIDIYIFLINIFSILTKLVVRLQDNIIIYLNIYYLLII